MAMPISLNIRYTKYVTGHNRYCLSLNKNTVHPDTLFFKYHPPIYAQVSQVVFSIHDFGLQFDVEYKLQGTLLRIFLLFMITCLFSEPNVSLTPCKIHSIYALLLELRRKRATYPYKRTQKMCFYISLFSCMH